MIRYLLLLMLSGAVNSQTLIVKDSVTGKPIPYVAVHSVDKPSKEDLKKSFGVSTDLQGTFTIPEKIEYSGLMLSNPSYETKTIDRNSVSYPIYLMPKPITAVASADRNRRRKLRRSGVVKRELDLTMYYAFYSTPVIGAKFFPYLDKYEKTPYLHKINVNLISMLPNAQYRLRLIEPDANGRPGTDLLNENIILTAAKGNVNNEIDLSGIKIPFGKKGLFIGIETIVIPSNNAKMSCHCEAATLEDRNQPAFMLTRKSNKKGDFWLNYFGEWLDMRKTKKMGKGRHQWLTRNTMKMEIELSD